MQSDEIKIPLAYFITFTCYGTWLHGEKDTSVDRHHNIFEKEFLSFNQDRYSSENALMAEPLYLLDHARRQIVLNTIKEVCQHREWFLLAAHVRTNHVHLVIQANSPPESILNAIKSYSSRRLSEANLDGHRINRWTRHGSTKYLWCEEDVDTTIRYVVYGQGRPMAVFENKNH